MHARGSGVPTVELGVVVLRRQQPPETKEPMSGSPGSPALRRADFRGQSQFERGLEVGERAAHRWIFTLGYFCWN